MTKEASDLSLYNNGEDGDYDFRESSSVFSLKTVAFPPTKKFKLPDKENSSRRSIFCRGLFNSSHRSLLVEKMSDLGEPSGSELASASRDSTNLQITDSRLLDLGRIKSGLVSASQDSNDLLGRGDGKDLQISSFSETKRQRSNLCPAVDSRSLSDSLDLVGFDRINGEGGNYFLVSGLQESQRSNLQDPIRSRSVSSNGDGNVNVSIPETFDPDLVKQSASILRVFSTIDDEVKISVKSDICFRANENLSQGLKLMVPNGSITGCGKSKRVAEEGNYDSKSIESRLLGSIVKQVDSKVDNVSLEVNGYDEFEPGTQLKELMNLCSNGSVECPLCGKDITALSEDMRNVHTNYCLESGSVEPTSEFEQRTRSSNSIVDSATRNDNSEGARIIPFEESDVLLDIDTLETDGYVECPLCGSDITSLSTESRLLHTNECLDKHGEEVELQGGSSRCTKISVSVGQVVDANPVTEWLRSLGLSKYEEVFIKEEVDWETLKWLTEEDLINIGVVALGPRKKITHALENLRKGNVQLQNTDSNLESKNEEKPLVVQNKLITEYFRGCVSRTGSHNNSRPAVGKETGKKDPIRKRTAVKRNHANKRKSGDIPPWCCIPGTPFRVDAFRYLRGDCSHWFLTHFHLDHYQGLTKNFCHGKVYCSAVTAQLVHMKIGVPWNMIHVLPINKTISVSGVDVTCLDANHCPGSVILLFQLQNGKAILHTGDFRFSEEMASNPILRSCSINTLILDTTYCNPQYDFPKQEAVIQFVIEAIQAEAFNPKALFLIGSYNIGKEKLFLEVARLLKKKLYVEASKLRLLSCLGLPDNDMKWFTTNEGESQIHVVPLWSIASFKRMKHMSDHYSSRYNLIVAFSPTGWMFGKGKKKTPGRRWQQGTIIRYEVPYSEHSSFSELKEFVRFISPEQIIPAVNNDGPESAAAMISLLKSEEP